MSPEQCRGENLDGALRHFSRGIIAYQMLQVRRRSPANDDSHAGA